MTFCRTEGRVNNGSSLFPGQVQEPFPCHRLSADNVIYPGELLNQGSRVGREDFAFATFQALVSGWHEKCDLTDSAIEEQVGMWCFNAAKIVKLV